MLIKLLDLISLYKKHHLKKVIFFDAHYATKNSKPSVLSENILKNITEPLSSDQISEIVELQYEKVFFLDPEYTNALVCPICKKGYRPCYKGKKALIRHMTEKHT